MFNLKLFYYFFSATKELLPSSYATKERGKIQVLNSLTIF